MNFPNLNQGLIHQIKQPVIEVSNLFCGNPPCDVKETSKDPTVAGEMLDESEEHQYQWRSNILISSSQSKERSPFALRHLTSFQQKSMDNHGKKLSQAFRFYISWVQGQKIPSNSFRSSLRLSNLDWETVENHIINQEDLTAQQKKLLISSAYKNTQAELLISQIIEQIPEAYYTGTLAITAFLISQYEQSQLQGKQQEDIQNYVSQSYILAANKIYDRICTLDIGNKKIKDHEKYFNFIRLWMEVIFLSLNGFLENPHDNRKPLSESGNFSQELLIRKLSAKHQ